MTTVFHLANKYAKQASHKKVVELIEAEINSLDDKGAYWSYQLPMYLNNSYEAIGRKDELIKKLMRFKTNLTNDLEMREKNMPRDVAIYVIEYPRVIPNLDTLMTEKVDYLNVNRKYELLIDTLSKAIAHMEKS